METPALSPLPTIVCCLCGDRTLAADASVRLLPVSLRHRAFAHAPCIAAYCARPCVWCAEPRGPGEPVLARGLEWEGVARDFTAEVRRVAVHQTARLNDRGVHWEDTCIRGVGLWASRGSYN